MLSSMFAAATGHRRLVLAGTLIAAFGFVGWSLSVHGAARVLLAVLVSLLVLGLAVLNLVALIRPRQAAFVADPHTPAFRTPAHEAQVFPAVLFMSAGTAAVLARLSAAEVGPQNDLVLRLLHLTLSVLAGAVVALALVHLAVAWRGLGVQLRPDALIDRAAFGTLTVPWQALAPDHPAAPTGMMGMNVALKFAHPELVHRRGLFIGSSVQVNNVDSAFLADSIRHYVSHPDHRPAIGTPAEYADLRLATPLP